MKLKNTIVSDEKEYQNVAFSLAISENISDGGITTSVAVRLNPYSDEFEMLDQPIPFVIGDNTKTDEEKELILDIKTAVEKFITAKGL